MKTRGCCKIFKFLMVGWFCSLFFIVPLFMIQFVKPYELHCDPKIDRTNAVPLWCLDAWPNVYSYVQFVYWDNRLFGMFYRSLDKACVSEPMCLIAGYLVYLVVSKQFYTVVSLGLYSSKEKEV